VVVKDAQNFRRPGLRQAQLTVWDVISADRDEDGGSASFLREGQRFLVSTKVTLRWELVIVIPVKGHKSAAQPTECVDGPWHGLRDISEYNKVYTMDKVALNYSRAGRCSSQLYADCSRLLSGW
jgi:hypothetical protein